MKKPTLIFAMDPIKTKRVLTPETMARLHRSCTLLATAPLLDWDSKSARELLPLADVLVSGWGAPALNAELLDRAKQLKLIAHSAGSVKRLILDPNFFKRGVQLVTAADANAVPVAEFTLAAILFANKNVFGFRTKYQKDRSRKSTDKLATAPIGNFKKTIGVIGVSRIGRLVVDMLKGFDLNVMVYDPLLTPDDPRLATAKPVSLDEVLSNADVVSLHAPLLQTTKKMIGRAELSRMGDGTTLINTARGALIDQEALIAELTSNRLNAILDVTYPEVPDPSSPLYDLPNVFLTPHMAGAMGIEQGRLGALVADEVMRFCAGEALHHAVTAQTFAHNA